MEAGVMKNNRLLFK